MVRTEHPFVLSTKQRVTTVWMGWSGGAMVLGRLPVPGRPTHFD